MGRVLVCRPLVDAEATARRLVEAGHVPLIAPVLEIVALPATLPPGPIDATLLTSRHALTGLAEAARARLRQKPLFAVGAATARLARDSGFTDVRIGGGDATSLVDLVTLTLRPGSRLMLLAGRVRKEATAEALGHRGFTTALCETYDARPTPPWPEPVVSALRDEAVSACLHFSRRSASLALAASQTAGLGAVFDAMMHLCLSEDVAGPLLASGLRVMVARRPDEASLLQALAGTLD